MSPSCRFHTITSALSVLSPSGPTFFHMPLYRFGIFVCSICSNPWQITQMRLLVYVEYGLMDGYWKFGPRDLLAPTFALKFRWGGEAFEALLDFTKSHVQYMYNILWACFIASLYDCFQTKKNIIHPHLSSLQIFQPFFQGKHQPSNPLVNCHILPWNITMLLMGKSTINGHFPLQNVSSPEGISHIIPLFTIVHHC